MYSFLFMWAAYIFLVLLTNFENSLQLWLCGVFTGAIIVVTFEFIEGWIKDFKQGK